MLLAQDEGHTGGEYPMLVLVDYNNIDRSIRHKGLAYVVDSILKRISDQLPAERARAHFRLYDGWYNEQAPTRICEDLAAEIGNLSPSVRTVLENEKTNRVRITVELAYSLAIEPNTHMFHTYREKSAPHGIACTAPRSAGCNQSPCLLASMPDFFNKERCPSPECAVRLKDILFRPEQKLVDAMLTSDIIHFAYTREESIAVVTSDDDFWPAIRTALLYGARVRHVLTKPLPGIPNRYATGLDHKYSQTSLKGPLDGR